MLTAKELRLGNKVYSVYSPYGVEQGRGVVSVTLSILNDIPNKMSFRYEPLPLSIELLESLGFINATIRNNPRNSTWVLGDIHLWADNKGNIAYKGQFNTTFIKHLHHLQNLYFALTGKELDI